jgi:hypothetical protein
MGQQLDSTCIAPPGEERLVQDGKRAASTQAREEHGTHGGVFRRLEAVQQGDDEHRHAEHGHDGEVERSQAQDVAVQAEFGKQSLKCMPDVSGLHLG